MFVACDIIHESHGGGLHNGGIEFILVKIYCWKRFVFERSPMEDRRNLDHLTSETDLREGSVKTNCETIFTCLQYAIMVNKRNDLVVICENTFGFI